VWKEDIYEDEEKVLIAAITILVLIAFASLPKIFHSG